MGLFKRLWQRVFICSLVLVVVSGAAGLYLVHAGLTDKSAGVVLEFTAELRTALKGRYSRDADAFLARFNSQEARFWLEDAGGGLIAGQPFEGRAGRDWTAHLDKGRHRDGVALWQTGLDRPRFLAIVPCQLADGPATLYAAYMSFPVPPVETLLSPGLFTMLLITGLLALWIALTVGRPLRRLQSEVAQISGNPPNLRTVTVAGSDEIADVARAVNHLVTSLKSHIEGMNRLIVNVSHELRSPLTRLQFSAEMIGQGLKLLRHNKAALNEQEANTARLAEANFTALCQELEQMDKLIGDTLLAGKLSLDTPLQNPALVSLSALCGAQAERFTPSLREKDIRFVRGIEPDIVVSGDETLLRQLVTNLLDNALKYAAGPEARVRLRLAREADKALLAVENSFSGSLDAQVLERLFEPYFRHEQRTGTGAGLGLAIVKRIVDLHGGRIDAASTDAGIVFEVRLPVVG